MVWLAWVVIALGVVGVAVAVYFDHIRGMVANKRKPTAKEETAEAKQTEESQDQ